MKKPELKPIHWETPNLVPQPEVHELFGEEALSLYLAAHAAQYRTQDERAYATTAAAPLGDR